MPKDFSARISIVFKQNQLKPAAIEDYFPDTMFKWAHQWETCPIDGCMNCIYKTLDGVDSNDVMRQLLTFVNSCLLKSCSESNDMEERVRVTRKLLAGTRLITFELDDYIQVLFNINWVND